jgi:DNA helicase IV
LLLHDSQNTVFTLKKNYRNTRQIANFAANFYVGLKSGKPDLPEDRNGSLPTVYIAGRGDEGKNLNAFVERIVAYAKLRNEEIGVLVPDNRVRTSLVNRLRHRLEPKIRVQTYARNDDTANAEDLVFDKEGHVTVLNCQSAKGLEFDSVFVVDPGKIAAGNSDALQAKMALYVMCSRARTNLSLMLVKDKSMETLLSWLPSPEGNYKKEEL